MIVFDCDGVLVDSEIISNQMDAELITEFGHPITATEMINRFIGRPKREIWAEIERDIGRPIPPELLERARAGIIDRYHRELKAIPGVLAAIDAIDGRRCVASSSEMPKLRLALELTGLLDRFDPWVFSASQVARGKPAPDVFLFAAAEMGVVPADCLVVEDSVAGVEAALAAGMRAIGFTGGSHSFAEHASRLESAGVVACIAHMDDLPDTILRLRNRNAVA